MPSLTQIVTRSGLLCDQLCLRDGLPEHDRVLLEVVPRHQVRHEQGGLRGDAGPGEERKNREMKVVLPLHPQSYKM